MKTWFVYDRATGYILSGFVQTDKNPFEEIYHIANHSITRLEFIYNERKNSGLRDLIIENLVVTDTDETNPDCSFVYNPLYLEDGQSRGWWKLDSFV